MSDRCLASHLSLSKALVIVVACSLLGATAAAAAPKLGGRISPLAAGGKVSPQTTATGFDLVGPTSASWGTANGVDIKVANVVNNTGATSGDLTLQLWATQVVPVVGNSFTFHILGSADLGSLPAGDDFADVDTGSVPFTPPPAGCYFVSVALLEATSDGEFLVDLRTFASGGVPEAAGFDGFGFGGDKCLAATTCTDTPTSACLLGGRFQVTVSYANAGGSGAGQVLSFGSTRAQSDESVFYFFTDPSNFEMGVKMLDACSLTNTFWVFIGGLTNQGWDVNILDTATSATKQYHNTLNTLTVTTADTAALPCP
jgi:hypothetical protein